MEKKLSNVPVGEQMLVSGNAAVFFTTVVPGNATTDIGKPSKQAIGGRSVEFVAWGDKNNLPNYREEVATGNNIVGSLIRRKRDIVCGQGWYAYRERYEDDGSGMMKRIVDEVPMPDGAKAFFEKFRMEGKKIVGEMMKHEMCIVEFIRNRAGGLSALNATETKHIRAAPKVEGQIKTFIWSNAWTEPQRRQLKTGDQVAIPIPIYNNVEGAGRQDRFCIPLMDDLFSDGYYPIPAWWGGRHWVELSNIIPLFHLNNLKNMSAPRWLLIIPHDYFLDYEKYNSATDESTKAEVLSHAQAKKQAFVNDFNELVNGVENTGKTLTIESVREEVYGKMVDKRITVEPLVIDLRDDALIKLYESSNVANISGQGLHPTLANIETQGRLSSGTEIRNAFLMWLVIAAPAYRDHLMRIVNLVKTIEGWPADIQYAIRDAELTTLAENPGGVQTSERAPV